MATRRGGRAGGARAGGTLDGALARLTAIRPGAHRVVSCYLKLEPRDRARGKYLIKLKNRVRALQQLLPELGLERAAQDAVREDLDRVVEFLRAPGNLPSSQGIAVFASRGARLFEAVALPSVHRSRLAVDRTPLVRELIAAGEEFGRVYTAVVDRASARVFAVTAAEAHEVLGIAAPDTTRGKRFRGDAAEGLGTGEHNYNNRIRQEKQRHYETVTRELLVLDRKEPAGGVVIAGTGADAAALEPFLPAALRDKLYGVAKLNPRDATPAAVHAATLEVREAHKRAEERALVEAVEARAGEGWAVNGLRDTLRALARGQVRTLLVAADENQPGWRCGESGRLVLDPGECRGEGDAIPVVDVIDDAIEEALRQRVEVNVVYEPGVHGLAGLLRFK